MLIAMIGAAMASPRTNFPTAVGDPRCTSTTSKPHWQTAFTALPANVQQKFALSERARLGGIARSIRFRDRSNVRMSNDPAAIAVGGDLTALDKGFIGIPPLWGHRLPKNPLPLKRSTDLSPRPIARERHPLTAPLRTWFRMAWAESSANAAPHISRAS